MAMSSKSPLKTFKNYEFDLDRLETGFLCHYWNGEREDGQCESLTTLPHLFHRQRQQHQRITKFGTVLNKSRTKPDGNGNGISTTKPVQVQLSQSDSKTKILKSSKKMTGINSEHSSSNNYCIESTTLFRGGYPGGDSEVSSVVEGFIFSCKNSMNASKSNSNSNNNNFYTTDDEIMAGESATNWKFNRNQNRILSSNNGKPKTESLQYFSHKMDEVGIGDHLCVHHHEDGVKAYGDVCCFIIDLDEELEKSNSSSTLRSRPLTLTPDIVDSESLSDKSLDPGPFPHFPDMTLWTFEELTHTFTKFFLGGLAVALLYKLIRKHSSNSIPTNKLSIE